MPKDKRYFLSNDCGGIAFWSLHNPVDPRYGHWVWGQIIKGRVVFIRPMTESEITKILTRFMVWGEKIDRKQSWALVVGVPGGSLVATTSTNPDHTGGVGV